MYPTAMLIFFAAVGAPAGFVDCAQTSLAADCARMIERQLAEAKAAELVPGVGYMANSPEWRASRERDLRNLHMIVKLPESGDLQDLEKFLDEERARIGK